MRNYLEYVRIKRMAALALAFAFGLVLAVLTLLGTTRRAELPATLDAQVAPLTELSANAH